MYLGEVKDINKKVDKETLEKIEKEDIKQGLSNLYKQLNELQEKIVNEKLSPIKRFLIETKISIIETRIENKLAKLERIELKEIFKKHKDEISQMYNKQLQEKQDELDTIFDEIEAEERMLEQNVSQARRREKDYKDINNVGKTKIKEKSKEDTYKFTSNKKVDENELKQQQEKLEELNNKKDAMKEQIIEFKKQFIEYEKGLYKDNKRQLKKYKPSIWKSIKSAFKRIHKNFIDWRENSKQEKEAIKEAKKKAIENIRTKPKKEKIKEQIEAQEQAIKQYQENAKRFQGKKFEFRDGNFVPVQDENESEKEKDFIEIDKWLAEHPKEKEDALKIILEDKPETAIGEIMTDENGSKEDYTEENAGEDKTIRKNKRKEKIDKDEREATRRKNLHMDKKQYKINHNKARRKAEEKALKREMQDYEKTEEVM